MLQQGNLYTHISHCPGVNKNLVRGVILAVYFLNAYAVLECTVQVTYRHSKKPVFEVADTNVV